MSNQTQPPSEEEGLCLCNAVFENGCFKKVVFGNNQLPPGQKFSILNSTCSWENIPQLAVITGTNGSGKTQLLKYLHSLAKKNDNVFFASYDSYDKIYSTRFGELISNERINEICSTLWKCIQNKKLPNGSLLEEIFKHLEIEKYETEKSLQAAVYQVINTIAPRKIIDPISYFKQMHIIYKQLTSNFIQKFDKISEIIPLWNYFNSLPSEEQDDFLQDENEPVSGQDVEFYQFCEILAKNETIRIRLLTQFSKTIIGDNPIDEINEMLSFVDFKYKIIIENDEELKFQNKENKKILFPKNLSSGERMIVSVIGWQFYVQDPTKLTKFKKVKIMILDEPDAHLDPKLSSTFFNVISQLTKLKKFGGCGVQVILTTHRVDTVLLAPQDCIYCLINKNDQLLEIKKAHRLHAISKMTGNIRELIDYKYRVYTESTNDALFYQGVYHSLQNICQVIRTKQQAGTETLINPVKDEKHPNAEKRHWPVPNTNKSIRLMSRIHTLEFHSVSERSKSGNKGGGGCQKVKSKILSDETSYANLFEENIQNETLPDSISRWHKMKNILNDPRLYYSYGIIDNDYGTQSVTGLDFANRVIILSTRHSLENFILDPIVLCSTLSNQQLIDLLSVSALNKSPSLLSQVQSLLLNIKVHLMHSKDPIDTLKLQKKVQTFVNIVLEYLLLDKDSKGSTAHQVYLEIENYVKLLSSKSQTSLLSLDEHTYIINRDNNITAFTIKFSSLFLRVRGHDIEKNFFAKTKDFDPVDTIARLVFNNGISIIPLDLAEMICDLANRVRVTAREVVKPAACNKTGEVNKK